MRELSAGDVAAILAPLRARHVDCILVGGAAAWAHGASQRPHDIDVVVRDTPPNLENAAAVLYDLRAGAPDYSHYLAQDSLDRLPPAPINANTLAVGDTLWETPYGGLDLLHSVAVPGAALFHDDLLERAAVRNVAGVRLPVASIADVIATKAYAARNKDRPVVDELRRLSAIRNTAPKRTLANPLDTPAQRRSARSHDRDLDR